MNYKTHIIYLKDNDFSCEMKEDAIKSCEKFNIEYELFNGIKAEESKDFLIKKGVNPSKKFSLDDWTPGTIGCFASHYSLWEKCVEENENFLILEHDGVIIRNPNEIIPLIDDVCHLDSIIPFNDNEVDYFKKYDNEVYDYKGGVIKYPVNKFYGDDEFGSTFRGLYGYILTPKGAFKLLNFVSKYGALPADKSVCERAVNLQRSSSTYVRLNPFFKSVEIQRKYSTR